MKRVVILGAGFGGLELSTRLAELVPSNVDITLVDQRDHFYVGYTKIDVLFGRKTAAQVKQRYADLAQRAVKFRQEKILSIDPAAKRVVTSGATLDADVLVVALGADCVASATPGLVEHGHEFYTLEGAEAAHPALSAVMKGKVLISILGVPYKCPPAPYEVALQVHDLLARKGVRADVTIQVTSPQPVPLPVTKDGSEIVARLMEERGIVFTPNTLVTTLSPGAATTRAGDRIDFDLFLGVPVHKVPQVVVDAGLAAAGGWISVDARTLETKFPDVYAIGDVTSIPVGAGAIPKAGAFADRAARAVADDIVGRMKGTGARGSFDGAGSCYLELGEGLVAEVKANFLAGPAPSVVFTPPTADLLPQKIAFAADRIDRWFRKG